MDKYIECFLWNLNKNATRHLADDQSKLVQVMTWFRQAISHYLNQYWPSSLSPYGLTRGRGVNTLRRRQNGRHFPDGIFKCMFLIKMYEFRLRFHWSLFLIIPIISIPTLVQIMAWCRSGDKPLSEPVMVSLLTHICVTRPQWVKLCMLNESSCRAYRSMFLSLYPSCNRRHRIQSTTLSSKPIEYLETWSTYFSLTPVY